MEASRRSHLLNESDLAQEKSVEDQMQMFAARMTHALTDEIFAVDTEGVRPA